MNTVAEAPATPALTYPAHEDSGTGATQCISSKLQKLFHISLISVTKYFHHERILVLEVITVFWQKYKRHFDRCCIELHLHQPCNVSYQNAQASTLQQMTQQ